MIGIIVDTGAIYALLDRTDKHHQAALTFYNRLVPRSNLIVIEYVLLEVMTLLRSRGYSRQAIQFRENLLASSVFHLHYSSPAFEAATFAIFRQYSDKMWSYADCALLAAAQELETDRLFSFDHHIDQMGLVRVPSFLS